MAEDKIIAVIGGVNGSQGKGFRKAVKQARNGGFALRLITTDDTTPAAQAARDEGHEVVKADLDDRESLKVAFTECHGVYGVTFFWKHFDPETEKKHAGNIAWAAKEAGVVHVIWSTLEDTQKMGTGLNVRHFVGKAEANQAFIDAGLNVTFLLTSFYWDNFYLFQMGARRTENGLVLSFPEMPTAKMAGIAAEDIGGCAMGIFREGEVHYGKTVGIAGEFLTGMEMANGIALELKEPCAFVSPNRADYLAARGYEDIVTMFESYQGDADEYRANRSIEVAQRLNPDLQTYGTWVSAHRDKLVVAA